MRKATLALVMVFSMLTSMGFTIHVPLVEYAGTGKGIGLAYSLPADASLLRADWFYDWTSSHYQDARYVPMSWGGEDPRLPPDYSGYLLFLNEPEGQGAKSPMAALVAYGELRQLYPKAKLIIAGCGLWGPVWLLQFQDLLSKSSLPRPQGWHVHGYVESGISLEDVIRFWEWAKASIVRPGEEFWITEFGDINGDWLNFLAMYRWTTRNASRGGAPFANRLTGQESWYPSTWTNPPRMQLVNGDGGLTELGRYYREVK